MDPRLRTLLWLGIISAEKKPESHVLSLTEGLRDGVALVFAAIRLVLRRLAPVPAALASSRQAAVASHNAHSSDDAAPVPDSHARYEADPVAGVGGERGGGDEERRGECHGERGFAADLRRKTEK